MDEHHPGARASDLATIAREDAPLKATNAKQLFANTKLETLLPPLPSIHMVHRDAPIKNAFLLLLENKILSVPVFDQRQHRHTGFADILDFVTLICDLASKMDLPNDPDALRERLSDILTAEETFTTTTVKALVGVSRRNPWYAVQKNAPLRRAFDKMVADNLHRIPIVDGSGELYSLVTQSDLVRFIHKHMDWFGDVPQKTVGDLKVGYTDNVISVTEEDTVLTAFQRITEHAISGVAVVDDSGKVIGNISASDLKGIGYDAQMLAKVFDTVKAFRAHNQFKRGAIVVKPSDTLGHVIVTLVTNHIHRVYVVDEEGKAIGAISQVDVLRQFHTFVSQC